jgi:putative holliday junction resolvase
VIGMPVRMNTLDTHISDKVRLFGANLARKFIQIPVHFVDERFTSKIAVRSMIDSGVKKKDRRNKALIDQVSAVIILQSYMENKAFLKSRER